MPDTFDMIETIGIVGGGAWGTALALTAARAGRKVMLWAREAEVVAAINRDHENPLFLPGLPLDPAIEATEDLAALAQASDALLLVPPAQHLRTIAKTIAPHRRDEAAFILCSKGIEGQSGALMSEIIAETVPEAPVAILSGPTFASEVARGQPTAITLATPDDALGRRLAAALGTRSFRPYLSDDVIGAQIGGAVKNVLAIACGVVQGRKLGDNARAALITRGLAEMGRLATAKGGRAETLMGLSGLGDLTLTCTSLQSRNLSLGFALGEGKTLAEIQAGRRSVAEGVTSAAATVALARHLGIDMPISQAVDAILNRGAPIDEMIVELLSRPFKSESGKNTSDA